MTDSIAPFVALLPPSVIQFTKALKTFPKIEKAFEEYAQIGSAAEGTLLLDKKLRPILTDAGVGKSAAADIIEACSRTLVTKHTAKKGIAEQKARDVPATKGGQSPVRTTASTSEGRAVRKLKRQEISSQQQAVAGSDDDELALAVNADLYIDSVDPKLHLIQAQSQQSRFHLDTTDNASKEVDLKSVSLSLAGQELLTDCHLRLKGGVHYGLVGRNGTGKSTLLSAIGERLIPGIPRTVKILLVSQLSTARAAEDEPDLSVLDIVIRSDTERSRAMDEFKSLSDVLESQDETQIRDAVLLLHKRRATERLREARKIAAKWSGAKGAWARKDLIAAEREYETAVANCKGSAEAVELHGSPAEGKWSNEAAQLLLDSQSVLETVDASSTEARAQKILHGLGFSPERISSSYSSLSGGWRSRATLASALLQPAHLLLLDEPVNYLDLPAVLFVQEFIKSIPHTVVTVSHDREFLDTVADELVILRKKTLTYFDGNLTTYDRESRKARIHALKQQDVLDKKKAIAQKSIAEAAKSAKKTGDDNKLRMVKQRQRKLDERWGLEVNAHGHRFKLNRDFGGYHLSSRAGVNVEELDSTVKFAFPNPEALRFPGSLVHLEQVTVKYPGAAKNTIRETTLTIGPGERIALVGPNGHGKTTLLNTMVGTIIPSSGTVQRHPRARIELYVQHTLETLSAERTTALAHFLSKYPDAGEAQSRSFLGQLGLKGRTADTILLTGLSGGQLVRLGLAEVMWTSPDLVILDEVTTHLDSDTIDALVDALRTYTGAIVLASHDRYAVKRIIELAADPAALSDDEDEAYEEAAPESKVTGRTYLLRDGVLKLLSGGMDDYTEQVVKHVATQF